MCAAHPMNRARACGVRKALARTVAGSPARIPNLARATGCLGTRRSGPSTSGARVSKVRARGPKTLRQASASTPIPAAVRSTSPASTPADPSARGWTRSISGHRHRRPCSASGRVARYGEATPSGCTAEQTSCSSPGSVSSLVRAPPPGLSAPSSTVTFTPCPANRTAAARPLGPEPTTTAVLTFAMSAGLRVFAHRHRHVVGPRLPVDHVRDPNRAPLELTGGGVQQPVGLGLLVDRLGVQDQDPQFTGIEGTQALERLDELLGMQVTVTEVPAEHDAGHRLAVEFDV